MNKRQARKIALDIAIDLLDSELQGSSDRTSIRIELAGGSDHDDRPKVQKELDALLDQLIVKRQAYAD